MLFKISLVLLSAWFLGVLGTYSAERVQHGFFLAGFMLMLLAFARARDAAMREARRKSQNT
jgi:hypothetical protein